MTRPGNAAWLTASPMNARPLRTTNVPMTAQTIADEHRRHEAALHEAVGERVGEEADRVHQRPCRGSGARRRLPRRGGGRRRGRAGHRRRAGRGRGRRTSRRGARWSRTSSAGPWATSRPLMNAAWWKRCAAQIRSWVVAMTVLPARASASRTSIRSSWVVASTPVTGSSSRYSSGSAASARARKTRRRWPPDSAPIWRSRRPPSRPSRAPRATALAIVAPRLAADPEPGVAAHHHDLADGHRELPVDGLGLGHVGDVAGPPPGGPPRTVDRPAERLDEPGDQLEERALAGAVRADDRQQRAGRTSRSTSVRAIRGRSRR